MIELKKSDLTEFARTTVLANTPLSLFKGLVQCAGMERLRRWSTEELTAYYDRVTARAGRNEIVVGLAYAVLCAIALHAREEAGIEIDPSRLLWGQAIWDFMKTATIATSRIVLPSSAHRPTITVSSSSGQPSAGGLFGPDGRPLPAARRNPE